MNNFTIKDLENLTGVKAHTIRIWEQRYSFLKPRRTETNIRYYSNHELKKILNISLLNRNGYKISHIDRMTDPEIHEKILTLTGPDAQQERIINQLIQGMIDLELEHFENVLDNYIRLKGVEKAINQIIFPFMERIGILWVTNRINPAQEHLVSNIVRQKIIVGIDNLVTHIRLNKSVLLFLPEGEYHEIGLLFIQYLLKSRGMHTIYLGASVPLKDIEFIVNLKKPDFLYTHLTSVSNNFNLDRFTTQLNQRFPNTPVLISGRLARNEDKSSPPNIYLKKSLSEVMEFITTIQLVS